MHITWGLLSRKLGSMSHYQGEFPAFQEKKVNNLKLFARKNLLLNCIKRRKEKRKMEILLLYKRPVNPSCG